MKSKIRGKRAAGFTTSGDYWEARYAYDGNSGAGSYGRLAEYKAEVLNSFVVQHGMSSIIEFGSGDGNQLSLAKYPEYIGVDVSDTAVLTCRQKFAGDAGKVFVTLSEYGGQKADLALSLDVIYHLVEDETFTVYMTTLFDAADRFVIVYSSNKNEQPEARHMRHRKFTDWVDENRGDFRLHTHIPNKFPFDVNDPNNTSRADFYIFERSG
jgi:protein O-GlcNAc transferase